MRKLFIILLLLVPSTIFSQTLKEQAEQVINNHFESNIRINFEKYKIPAAVKSEIQKQAQQRFYKDFVYLWTITNDDSLLAYAILDNVRGKSALITVLSIFDTRAVIQKVEIMKYRGEHGREIDNKGWLAQLTGKDMYSGFQLGVDISAVSGATISATSLLKGSKKWCLLINTLIE